jgi:hypothetical protein
MSTWMNRASGFHCGPSPWPSSQFSRADQHHHIGPGQRQRPGRRHRLRMIIGQQSLGHRHRQERDPGRLHERPDLLIGLGVGGALAEHDQRPLGPLQQAEGAVDSLRRGQLPGRGVGDLPHRPGSGDGVHRLTEHLAGNIEIDAAGPARDGRADRPGYPSPMSSTRSMRYAALANGRAAASWSSSSYSPRCKSTR